MKEIALLTLFINEHGEEFIINAYNNADEAERERVDLIFKTGDPNYYIQYVQLK